MFQLATRKHSERQMPYLVILPEVVSTEIDTLSLLNNLLQKRESSAAVPKFGKFSLGNVCGPYDDPTKFQHKNNNITEKH